MSKKKTLLTILAVMLVCCIAVVGTLAFLTEETDEAVVNTFTAAGGGKLIEDDGSFDLKEHEAVRQDDGSYELNTTEVQANDYSVVPSTDLPKDPFVRILKKTEVPAYLYVEVVDGLANSGLSYTMADCWAKLDGVTGKNSGAVYVYCDATTKAPVIVTNETDLSSIAVLSGNIVKVDDSISITAENGIQLKFYGYLAQASAGAPADAFNICFNNTEAGA